MEIVGVGTDIVECLRIGRMIEQHGELFLTRIFTEREIRHCHGRKRTMEHFAAHWAAKEAILRALQAGWHREMNWTEIDIRIDANGQPHVHLSGAAKELAVRLQVTGIHLALAHCRAYATAYALAVRGGPDETRL